MSVLLNVSRLYLWLNVRCVLELPADSNGNKSACSAGHPGSVPGSGGSPGGGHGYPLQHSCLENPMDRGAGRATLHGVAVRHDGAPESRLSRCVLEKRPPAHGGASSPGRPGPVPSLVVLSRLQTGAATPACVSLSSVTLCSTYLPAA